MERPPAIVVLPDRQVDLQTGAIRVGGVETARLTATEMALLAYLAARPGEPVSRYTLLEEVWGYEDNVVSRTVDTTVRRLRGKLERDPAAPVHVVTEYGFGYRFEPAPVAGEFPLPADRTFGRKAVTQQVLDALDGLVTLTGPAGVGKTRLAQEVGRAWIAQGHGATFCALAAADDHAGVLQAVVDRLGVAGGGDPAARVGYALAGRGKVLLVLDNAEHVAEAVGSLVARWRDAAPEARLLVTSRAALQLRGERVIEVRPLAQQDGVAMFRDRAHESEDEDAVSEIVRRLDALPLALELAAARTRVLSARQVLDRLHDRLSLLVSRETALRTAIDASWDLLDDHERAVFRQCGVFRGPFTAEAAEAVVAAPAVLDVLERLADQSLLQVAPGGDARRLLMLENLRAYALERLREAREEQATRDRHRDWFVAEAARLAESVEQPGGIGALRRLARDVPDVLAAYTHALDTDPAVAARAALALHPLLRERGSTDAHVALLSGALEHASRLPAEVRARLRHALGEALRIQGRLAESAAAFDAALAEQVGPGVRARVLAARSLLLMDLGRYDASLGEQDRADALAREADDPWLQAYVEQVRGLVRMEQGRVAAAEAHGLRALDLFRAVGDERRVANVLMNLGFALLASGRAGEARARFDAALAIHLRDVGPRKAVAGHVCLGNVAAWQGDLEGAEEQFRAAERIGRAVGLPREVAVSLANVGWVLIEAGRLEEARAALTEARDTHRGLGALRSEATAACNLGILEHLVGDVDRAATLLGESDALFDAGGDERGRAYALAHLGAALAESGAYDEAAQALSAAHATGDDLGDARFSLLCDLCAGHAAVRTDPERARAALERAHEAPDPGPNVRVAARLLARALG